MKEDQKLCEICRDRAQISRVRPDVVEIECGRCGRYWVTGSAREALGQGEWREKAWVLACVTRNAWVSSRRPLLLKSDNITKLIEDAPIATSPIEVIDRILSDFSYTQRSDGGFAGPFTIAYDKHVLYYLPSHDDLRYVLQGMQALGYGQGFSNRADTKVFNIEISVQGWQRAADLEKASVQTWQAFVAMHFTEDLLPAFDDGIRPALIATGYTPVRVDRIQHNEKIDDRIVAELRRSGLVIADFTGHRGGVYFECGYAMGRATPVIWCCRSDDIGKIHFDTRQYNHIVWGEPGDLRIQLIDRIRATLPFRDRERQQKSAAAN